MQTLANNRPLILASQSPRRKLLLKQAGLDFEIIVSHIEETYPKGLSITEIPAHIAQKKAIAVSQLAGFQGLTDGIIIAADTIVALREEQQLLGKPSDRQAAYESIRQLSGRKHEVITGYCIWSKNKELCRSVSTAVYFNELSDEQIFHYIDHYEPYDKAGAYAIQEWIGMIGIEKIEGCYFNVMGLPVSHLLGELAKF